MNPDAAMKTGSAPRWLVPAQRMLREIADLYARHAADAQTLGHSSIHGDLTELLRAAHALELRLGVATKDDHAAARRELLRLLSPIRSYCVLLDEPVDGAALPMLETDLRGVALAVDQFSQQLREVSPEPAPLIRNPSEPGRLLLVEPDAQLLPLFTRILGDAGHELDCADGTELCLAKANPLADLILLGVDDATRGERLLQKLQRHFGLPVLVLTSTTDQRDLGRWLELGADDCIGAPLDPALLQLRIGAALERKRWREREQNLRRELERSQRFIRRVFGRYLSPEIVDELLENPDGLHLGGVQRTVTVLLADIRGFSTLCEQLAPDRVMELLNIYLGTMAEIVLGYRGTVDEFIGDAVLAIFGAPVSRHDDAHRALQCGLEMQRAIADINARNAAKQLPPIEIGISINTGRVVAGNVGSELRCKYAVVGHAVNQTARIQETCSGGRILTSAATLRAARYFVCIGDNRELQARGMQQPIEVFEVLSLSPLADRPQVRQRK